jgi:hypothetical protein
MRFILVFILLNFELRISDRQINLISFVKFFFVKLGIKTSFLNPPPPALIFTVRHVVVVIQSLSSQELLTAQLNLLGGAHQPR